MLQDLLKFIFNELSRKYSSHAALELMKKLLLNRFFLNPTFYVLYNEPNEKEIKDYVHVANYIRVIFLCYI